MDINRIQKPPMYKRSNVTLCPNHARRRMAGIVQTSNVSKPLIHKTGARCTRHAAIHENRLRQNFIAEAMNSPRLDEPTGISQPIDTQSNNVATPKQPANLVNSATSTTQIIAPCMASVTSPQNNMKIVNTVSRSLTGMPNRKNDVCSTSSHMSIGIPRANPSPSRMSIGETLNNIASQSRSSTSSRQENMGLNTEPAIDVQMESTSCHDLNKETGGNGEIGASKSITDSVHRTVSPVSIRSVKSNTSVKPSTSSTRVNGTSNTSCDGCICCGKPAMNYTCHGCATKRIHHNNNNSINSKACKHNCRNENQDNKKQVQTPCETNPQDNHKHFAPHINVRTLNMQQGAKLGFRPLVAGLGEDKSGLTEPWTSSNAKMGITSKVVCIKKRDCNDKVCEPIGGFNGNVKKSICPCKPNCENNYGSSCAQNPCANTCVQNSCGIDQSPVCAGISLPVINNCSNDQNSFGNSSNCCPPPNVPCPPIANICDSAKSRFNTISMLEFAFENDNSLTAADIDCIISKAQTKRNLLTCNPCSSPPTPCPSICSTAGKSTTATSCKKRKMCGEDKKKSSNINCSNTSLRSISKCSVAKKISNCRKSKSCRKKSSCSLSSRTSTCNQSKPSRCKSSCSSTKVTPSCRKSKACKKSSCNLSVKTSSSKCKQKCTSSKGKRKSCSVNKNKSSGKWSKLSFVPISTTCLAKKHCKND